MNCYNPSTLTWNASKLARTQQYPGNILPSISLSVEPFTATSPRFIVSLIKDKFRKRTPLHDNTTSFMMRHSQQAFSEIWDDPEEDIWDEL